MKVTALTIYPIKALAGIALSSAVITGRGLKDDRRFMLTNQSGKFITQRSHPELTAFSVQLKGETLVVEHSKTGKVEFSARPSDGPSSRAVVWNDAVDVTHVSDEVDAFFSDALGEHIRLAGMPDSSIRLVDQKFGGKDDAVSFADGYPMLVLGSESIDELNNRIAAKGNQAVPVNRFRPNILISGSSPWKEDSWTAMHFSNASIRLIKPCARCIVIRTDQETGIRHAEPLETLLTYRKFDTNVLVGMNAIPTKEAVGCVIKTGESFSVSD